VKRSPPNQTSPAQRLRAGIDLAGTTPRAKEKIGFVMVSRRKAHGGLMQPARLSAFLAEVARACFFCF